MVNRNSVDIGPVVIHHNRRGPDHNGQGRNIQYLNRRHRRHRVQIATDIYIGRRSRVLLVPGIRPTGGQRREQDRQLTTRWQAGQGGNLSTPPIQFVTGSAGPGRVAQGVCGDPAINITRTASDIGHAIGQHFENVNVIILDQPCVQDNNFGGIGIAEFSIGIEGGVRGQGTGI